METVAVREERASTEALQAGAVRVRQTGAGSLPLNTAERQALLAIGDAIAGAAGCFAAVAVWMAALGRPFLLPRRDALFFAVAWIVALFVVDGYDVQIPASRVRSVVVVMKAAPLAGFAGFLAFFAAPYAMTRPVIVLSVAFGAALVVAMRLTIARALLHERFAKRALLVIARGDGLTPLLKETLQAARFEYRIVGVVDIGATEEADAALQVLRRSMRDRNAQEVIVANDDPRAVRAALDVCFSNGIRVWWARDLIERFTSRVPLTWVDESWFLTLPGGTLGARPYIFARRLVDILLAALIGIPFVLLLPLLAVAIKVDSPGQVFFQQRRLGRHGRQFSIPKLRTMRSDAELAGHQWAEREDPRVTRVGRFLRITRLDEVPQVLNVLKGEMSFIGPRPERPEFVNELEKEIPHYRARLAVKPGISGWAQVKAGYAGSVAESARKLEYDLYYVKNQSLRLDLQIVLHTLFTVLGLRGR